MVAEASVNSGPRGRRWLAAAAALYAAAVAIVLFWPVHVDGDGGLFRFDPVLDLLGRFGIPAWASYSILEFAEQRGAVPAARRALGAGRRSLARRAPRS